MSWVEKVEEFEASDTGRAIKAAIFITSGITLVWNGVKLFRWIGEKMNLPAGSRSWRIVERFGTHLDSVYPDAHVWAEVEGDFSQAEAVLKAIQAQEPRRRFVIR